MRSFVKFAVGAVAALALVGPAYVGPAAAQQQLSISTGGTGGVYYPLGGGFANILTKAIPGVAATAEVTGGSVDNLNIVGSYKGELAFTQVDATIDALKGQDKFKSKLPIRALAVLYPNVMHIVTVDGTGINTLDDLKGKRISTGSPGSATEVYAFRVLEAAGLDKDKDVKRERLGAAEIRQCDQRPQDRCVLLCRRRADLGDHRPGQHARHQTQDDRPRTGTAEDGREVWTDLFAV